MLLGLSVQAQPVPAPLPEPLELADNFVGPLRLDLELMGLLLLTGPQEEPVKLTAEQQTGLAPTLRRLSVALELKDVQEAQWDFQPKAFDYEGDGEGDYSSFACDIYQARCLLATPPVSDLTRFRLPADAAEQCERVYAMYLAVQHRSTWSPFLNEQLSPWEKPLLRCWMSWCTLNHVRELQGPTTYPRSAKRWALQNLRNLIGPEHYAAGTIPSWQYLPPVLH